MSEFKAEVIKVGPVVNHPNADRLDIAKAFDFDAVIGRGYLKPGDLAVYIPEGALVTPEIIKCLGNIKLAGPAYNRVKATKIRGWLSQGLLLSIADAETCITAELSQRPVPWEEGLDVTEILGIKKWDPDEYDPNGPNRVKLRASNVYHCPDKVVGFDVENIKKIRKFFTPGERVVVTEKIHGTFCLISVWPDGDIVISSKGHAGRGDAINITAQEEESNIYLKVGLPIARQILATQLDYVKQAGGLTFMGEIYGPGVQDLTYGEKEPKFRCFDAIEGKCWLNTEDWLALCAMCGVDTVPIVAVPMFDVPTIEVFAAEKSAIGNNNLREGVVIRAANDSRRKAKFINPEYLTRKGGTEYN